MAKRTERVRLNNPDPDDDDEGEGKAADRLSKRRIDPRTVRTGVEKSMLNIIPRWGAGRPPGSRNALPAKITRAMEEALDDYPGGPAAYMRWLMVNEPATYGALLKRKLPQVVHADLDPDSLMGKMLRAAAAARQQQQGAPVSNGAALINLKPTPRGYAVEDYGNRYATEDFDDR